MKKLVAIILCICMLFAVVGCDSSGTSNNTDKAENNNDNNNVECAHNYAEATCTAPKTCTNCGDTDGTALDHTYGEYVVVKNATCAAKGTKERSCSLCGNKETADIAMTDHTWTNATCASPKKCTVCGKTEGNTIPHAKAPDANWKCSDCGQTIYTDNYKYIASSDFRSIKNDYNSAVAKYAYITLYRADDKAYVLVDVYYTIGSKSFNDVILHNISDGTRIKDPVNYYEKLKDRAYGATKLYYLDVQQDLLQMLVDQYTKGYMVDGDYLNTYS